MKKLSKIILVILVIVVFYVAIFNYLAYQDGYFQRQPVYSNCYPIIDFNLTDINVTETKNSLNNRDFNLNEK